MAPHREYRFDLDHFAADWARQARAWIENEVRLHRLPPHLADDIFQQAFLRLIEAAKSSGRAAILRRSMDYLKQAIAEERKFYRRATCFDGKLEHVLFSERDSPYWTDEPDEPEWPQLAWERLSRRLSARELKLLELRYLAVAPGKERPYNIKEVAELWGVSYDYLRRRASETVKKARRIIAETRDELFVREAPVRPATKRLCP